MLCYATVKTQARKPSGGNSPKISRHERDQHSATNQGPIYYDDTSG